MNKSHTFMSYVREDRDTVDRLVEELENAGISVWLDREQIKPGKRWQDSIRRAIEEAAFFVACFSEASQDRAETHMNEELRIAVNKLRLHPRERRWFITVLLDSVPVPDLEIAPGENLRGIQWIDLHEDWTTGVQTLIDLLGGEARKMESCPEPQRHEPPARPPAQGTTGFRSVASEGGQIILENNYESGHDVGFDNQATDFGRIESRRNVSESANAWIERIGQIIDAHGSPRLSDRDACRRARHLITSLREIQQQCIDAFDVNPRDFQRHDELQLSQYASVQDEVGEIEAELLVRMPSGGALPDPEARVVHVTISRGKPCGAVPFFVLANYLSALLKSALPDCEDGVAS